MYFNPKTTQASGTRTYTHTVPDGYKLLGSVPHGAYCSGGTGIEKINDRSASQSGSTVTVTMFVYNPNNANVSANYELLYIRT